MRRAGRKRSRMRKNVALVLWDDLQNQTSCRQQSCAISFSTHIDLSFKSQQVGLNGRTRSSRMWKHSVSEHIATPLAAKMANTIIQLRTFIQKELGLPRPLPSCRNNRSVD